MFLATYDVVFKSLVPFDEYLAERGQLEHAQEPDDIAYNPYTWRHGQDGTKLWDVMAQKPAELQIFQAALPAFDMFVPVVGHFDFGLLQCAEPDDRERMELVDVGGGQGSCLKQILHHYPKLTASKCVLQDTKENIDAAKENSELPSGLNLMEHNFWKEQPIRGAKGYLMRYILHNYQDGASDFGAVALDMYMLCCGGKERTTEGFESLLEQVDLEWVKSVPSPKSSKVSTPTPSSSPAPPRKPTTRKATATLPCSPSPEGLRPLPMNDGKIDAAAVRKVGIRKSGKRAPCLKCRKNKITCGSTNICDFWDYFKLPEESEEEDNNTKEDNSN
ncbi:hypothetical protein EYZ11_009903 [Aspergillus tanneri]|uniref:O-methyltransferase C-terminal domain-containing protein n=1 Tax=Aspergillus tanneri TaxID=1220188 RepID=A0A4S3JC33_9EURO|nr:hypothetical protein EYZ11_009903 [Aspergillus tanneri]